ncbi:prolyl oligopeptidase family serine peptidase [Lysobacter silvisoli]|uniref:Phospholipase n=1 Tax=Lysobacter silvisoli TaxID=2293254 RepID=A0A371K6A5_9GAMM|nr:prolyl oligopeptidase family serine peptidase [Lysobacter silvisoli]RDZ29398.1 phospholipase [Lysobacter silvisoli]
MLRPLTARLLAIFLLLALMAVACTHTPASRQHGAFVARSLSVDGREYRYQVFVPSRAAGGAHPPVVLFLHGSGERGDDNQRQVAVGLGPWIGRHVDEFPAIAVFPQSPADRSWTDSTARMALAALDAAIGEFGGDPERVALTGLSRGGYGVYELAMMQPDRFAALVPICGGITAPEQIADLYVHEVATAEVPFAIAAQRLQRIPVWIFHGALDEAVPVQQSRLMAQALRQAGGDVRYTEFAEAGHNAWDPAYATAELWPWLWRQRRR